MQTNGKQHVTGRKALPQGYISRSLYSTHTFFLVIPSAYITHSAPSDITGDIYGAFHSKFIVGISKSVFPTNFQFKSVPVRLLGKTWTLDASRCFNSELYKQLQQRI